MQGSKNVEILLMGNGPYENRGCEAIVRGTTALLGEVLPDASFRCGTIFQSVAQLRQQAEHESDARVAHNAVNFSEHGDPFERVAARAWRSLRFGNYFHRKALGPQLRTAKAMLAVGGDNFTLDYGPPTFFMDMNRFFSMYKIPTIIWGASIGPFSSGRWREKAILDHLATLDLLAVRETLSLNYLRSAGLTNVELMGDPAFCMDPVAPKAEVQRALPLDQPFLGLNLSPLMARYVTGGNLDDYCRLGAKLVAELVERVGMPVVLIYHVTGSSPKVDDHALLQGVKGQVSAQNANSVFLLPPGLSAAQLKWVIARAHLFMGARTHSTIAAFSSGVPTLSFAYSRKALGLVGDILGSLDYCVEPGRFDIADILDRTRSMLANREAIARATMGAAQKQAAAARRGAILVKDIIDKRDRG